MIKTLLRNIALLFRLDLTKNLAYDRKSRLLIRQKLKKDANCIDVGAHKGEVLAYLLKQFPSGKHQAYEPVPELFFSLKEKFGDRVSVFPYALSNTNALVEFQWVKNAPAYSGLKKRSYAIKKPKIETIQVETRLLDDLQQASSPVHFLKIDVEGAEYLVLKGAENTLKTDRPFVLFEFGLGASDYYDSTAEELFHFFEGFNYKLYTLDGALKNSNALTLETFQKHYQENTEYYFWAQPK